MRGNFTLFRAAFALLAALGLLVSLAGCGPDAPEVTSATASPRTTVATPTPVPVPSPAVTPNPLPSPTPTPRIIRDEIHRHLDLHTPCFGGLGMSTAFVRWSRDGSAIIFSRDSAIDFSRDSDVVWVAPDGSALRQLPVVGPMTAVDVSPDGSQVVYSTCAYPTNPGFTYTPSTRHETDADGNPIIVITSVDPNPELLNYDHELVRVNVDGSEPQRLTTNTRFDSYPAWSPDGTRIAYLSIDHRYPTFSNSHSDFLRLYTMAPDGSDIARVRDGAVNVRLPPQWSPDGKRIAYVRHDSEFTMWLYTIEVDGGAPRRLRSTVSGPSWSPDGQRLAFAKADGDEVALYTVAADSSDSQRVTTITGITGWQPRYGESVPTRASIGGASVPPRALIGTVAWSPDGSKILFSCGGGICVVSLDGTPVSEAPLPGNAAAWSPDGSRIALLSTENGPVVQTVAPDGSDAQVLVLAALGGPIPAQLGHEDVQASQAACAAGFVVDAPAENPGLVRDCETLLGLRDALFPVTLVNWGPGTPITEWAGVTVDSAPPRVTGLALYASSSTSSSPSLTLGTLPPELGQLTALQTLDLGAPPNYGLSGPIPPEWGELANLEVLALSSRNITGVIPPELGQLTQLRQLTLVYTQITGPIPSALGQLESLTQLNLADNKLTGTIPAELGQLSNLEALLLGGNQLTGCIPPGLQGISYIDHSRLGLPDCELE